MRRRLVSVLLIAAASGTVAAAGSSDAATVARRTRAESFSAYAEVEPIHTTTVSASVAGTVAGLVLVPGDEVTVGQTVVRLTGSEQAAAAAQARTAVARATAALDLARKKAAEVEATYPELSTRQELETARAGVEEAKATLEAARAALAHHERAVAVRSPVAGVVLEVTVADGDRVAAGTPLLRLEPAGGLWVLASFYGAAAARLQPGMKGRFTPADGTTTIPVKVRSVAAELDPDGGRRVGCTAAGSPGWLNGERGTLTLEGPERSWAAVPTAALVLDAGRWWVLVEGADGAHRQEVEVGPEDGGWTLIRSGVEPGQKVVVKDVLLRFHRTIGERYQPSD